MGVVCAISVIQNVLVWRKTGNTLHLVQAPMYIFVIGSFGYLFVAMQDQVSLDEGVAFYLIFTMCFPILIIWAEESTRRMGLISSTAEFQLGLPMPSKSYQLLGTMGKLIQELARPIVAVQGPSRINQKINELSREEPLFGYFEEGSDGRLRIDPRIVPVFQLTDRVKYSMVSLVDFLAAESYQMAGRLPKDQFGEILRNRVAKIVGDHMDLLIEFGLLDRLAGGAFSNRISSGLTDLDLATNGGYPKSSAILLCGPPSDERNLILDSFMAAGLARGDCCLYVTSAQPPENVQRQFGGLAKDLVIVDCYTNRVQEVPTITRQGNVITSPVEISVVSVAISRALDREGERTRRAVVDILPTYLVFQKVEKIYLDLMEIVDDLRKAGYTSIFSLNPYYLKDEGAIAKIEELFDGVVHVERSADASGVTDNISVRIEKMARQGISSSPFIIKKPGGQRRSPGQYPGLHSMRADTSAEVEA